MTYIFELCGKGEVLTFTYLKYLDTLFSVSSYLIKEHCQTKRMYDRFSGFCQTLFKFSKPRI